MMIGQKLIDYYRDIKKPNELPEGVELLFPFDQDPVIDSITSFYTKYFGDHHKRVLVMGINPGRFGGGVTGIPFTDPQIMEEQLSLPNNFEKKPELSSKFIYEMINHLGGAEFFYSKFLLSSVCPLGFVKAGKNMNYYDDKQLQESLEDYMVKSLKWHLEKVTSKEVVFSLGQGKNIKYLEYLNAKYHLFGKLVPLPHPRWILQYRRKRLPEFLDLYKQELLQAIE